MRAVTALLSVTMAIQNTVTLELMALRVTDPAKYLKRIRGALEAKGTVPAAAELLGMPRRTLQTWVNQQPELSKDITLRGAGNPDWINGKAPKKPVGRTRRTKSTRA